jgi:hypothetical protein
LGSGLGRIVILTFNSSVTAVTARETSVAMIVELSCKVPPFQRLKEGKLNCNIFHNAALKDK